MWAVGPTVIRLVGRPAISLRIESHAPLPDPPFVVAANHYSHLDPPLIGASIRRTVRFLALDELAEANRFLAGALPLFGAIPVPRVRLPIGALRTAIARLEAGEVVGVFPEGTRVARWGDRAPKRGAAWLACRTGTPLVPVAVVGTDRVFGVDNSFRRAPVRVIVGRALAPDGEDATSLTVRWADWMESRLG